MPSKSMEYSAPWGLAILLLFANIMSFVDRMLLTLLVKPIRADLAISDTQISLLHGLAFAVFYAVFGLPLGRIADSVHRPRFMSGGIALWSAMTAACGAATSFVTLFIARIGVAIGEATLSPASISLLSEKFPKHLAARAIGIFQSGIFIGTGLALLAGGTLLGWLEKQNFENLGSLGSIEPWRLVFIIVGLPGILVALLLLFIKDTKREKANRSSEDITSFRAAFELILKNKALYFGHILTFTAITILAYGSISWMPTVIVRTHEVTSAQAGLKLGIIVLLIGPIGVMASSALLDRFIRKSNPNGLIWTTIFSIILLAIAVPFYSLAPNLSAALFGACLLSFAQSFPYGIASSLLSIVTPANFRGQIIAIYLMISNLIGLTLGPLLVARFTDGFFKNDAMIKYSFALLPILTVPIAFIGIAIFSKALINRMKPELQKI